MSLDVALYTPMVHTDRGFFFFFFALPCDSSPTANIIPGPTAHAHDDPILVLQAEFRVESVRERERRERFEAVDFIFTAKNYELYVQTRCGSSAGYGKWECE